MLEVRMKQKNLKSANSSGVNSVTSNMENNDGLGVTVGQIEAPQPFNNISGSSQSNNLSVQTNGGVITEYGDEDNLAYVPTQTGSGRDQPLNQHSQLLLEEHYTDFKNSEVIH